ncbi:type II CAAX endopeptidase family protein (plasmid) [Rossellomorea sp. AcN35-11]|nr:CPBP family intramembrane metalloprotease [Rossellomorea aquimaris]WJV31767.1 type II CAAX endopeptidase family protein [Rossellomorea sp. AcN35-11]
MKKQFGLIVLIYLAVHFSGLIGYPLMYYIGFKFFGIEDFDKLDALSRGYWLVISFVTGLILVWIMESKRVPLTAIEKADPISKGNSVAWVFGGVVLVFIGQAIAVQIESAIGITSGSQNTQGLINLIKLVPLVVFVVVVIGPILEEFIFRKIIFGVMYEKTNFVVAALVSSLLFALIHFEFEHIIIYTTMGFSLAFIYKMTKRLIVPIMVHILMNAMVFLIQFFS